MTAIPYVPSTTHRLPWPFLPVVLIFCTLLTFRFHSNSLLCFAGSHLMDFYCYLSMSSKLCSIMYKNGVVCLKSAIHPVNFPCALTSRASRLSLPSSILSLVFGLAPAFANEPALRLWTLTGALHQHSRPSTLSPKRADQVEQMPGCGRTARAARVALPTRRLALLEPSQVGRQRVPGGTGIWVSNGNCSWHCTCPW